MQDAVLSMDTPLCIVNLKTYAEGSGKAAVDTALVCEKVARQEDATVAVAVQNADIDRIASRVDIPVLAQHLDPEGHGSNTGKDVADTLAFNGADGALINHSEDQVPIEAIEGAVERAREAGLTSIVCVDAPELGGRVSRFGPDFVAYEPPELIGGDVSVADAKPGLVQEAVEEASVTVLCGAGIKSGADVAQALELGAEGVLVASGVVKADGPETALRGLIEGMQG